jgi:hypothetical protein
MPTRNRPSGLAAVLLIAATLVTVSAMPDAAWAGPHHESNQGEVFKPAKPSVWAKVVHIIKTRITRPIEIITGGGDSGPTCR